jgi:hypothetical protein
LQGAGGTLHNAGFEVLIQLRHRTMLARLAGLCESEAAPDERPDRQDTAGPAEAHGAGHA